MRKLQSKKKKVKKKKKQNISVYSNNKHIY